MATGKGKQKKISVKQIKWGKVHSMCHDAHCPSRISSHLKHFVGVASVIVELLLWSCLCHLFSMHRSQYQISRRKTSFERFLIYIYQQNNNNRLQWIQQFAHFHTCPVCVCVSSCNGKYIMYKSKKIFFWSSMQLNLIVVRWRA